MLEKFIRMNVELPGFTQGQQWLYDEAPDAVKWWLKNKSILFETIICSVIEDNVVNNTNAEVENVKADNILFRKFDVAIKTKEAEESGVIIEKEVIKKIKKRSKKATSKKKSYNSNAPKCKGIKSDGYPCRTTKLLENGYCRHHQDQADQNNNEGMS